ncbi:PDZ domain-containing protein [Spirosoma fluviale]|uniref:Right handed beta helix region n=1 Tax=Spirosoma fluviale TaxID=1597977 RepID=A0A286G8Y4_9BACT|nr:PDZ domain-containing protein [Spirosoma fluviale]SOD91666.1 Right handed beta helix region [Spirosoma fluviale]
MKNRILLFLSLTTSTITAQTRLFVSPSGRDTNPGTLTRPLATVQKALEKVKETPADRVQILLRGGMYFLPATLHIDPQITQGKALLIGAYQAERVQVSGGRPVRANWQKGTGNVWTADVAGPAFEQLFINGKKQILARYPNYDARARVFNGTAADAISEARISRWQAPAGGYVHALHRGEWGDFHYRITGKKTNEVTMEGGWQNNRPAPMHPKERFVENIAEELDAPGEWFYDKTTHKLSLIPAPGVDLTTATVEVSRLKGLVELVGEAKTPLKHVRIQGIRFVNAERTFMEPYEPLLRGDWMIYRGGAVFLENTENCRIDNCEFTDLGGNAVFISRYNRNAVIKGAHMHHIGASAICFVGDSSAVRSPAFRYELFVPYAKLDKQPGPKNEAYPAQCVAEDNLIHHIGQLEKQSAGVQISMASGIVVRHNSIYQVPRAGININDGTWGGHLLEFNDVFDTVLETGDHGAFNSWGRDRFWHPNRGTMDSVAVAHPELILLDAQAPVIIRNNRFRCDHGWDVDLDDGSSNYHIYNNVFLNGGLKFREGFQRVAENNILINNSFHPHVWFATSGDVFRRNIVMRSYAPIGITQWGKELDANLFPDAAALQKAQKNGTDAHSLFGDPHFVNAATGDYRVKDDSPAKKTGFQNFLMNQFGVQTPALRALAETPKLPVLLNAQLENSVQELVWLGTSLRNVHGLGDRSAFGLPDEKGVIVVDIPAASKLAQSGLKKGDVIRTANDEEVPTIGKLIAIQQGVNWTGRMDVTVIRNQQITKLTLPLK